LQYGQKLTSACPKSAAQRVMEASLEYQTQYKQTFAAWEGYATQLLSILVVILIRIASDHKNTTQNEQTSARKFSSSLKPDSNPTYNSAEYNKQQSKLTQLGVDFFLNDSNRKSSLCDTLEVYEATVKDITEEVDILKFLEETYIEIWKS